MLNKNTLAENIRKYFQPFIGLAEQLSYFLVGQITFPNFLYCNKKRVFRLVMNRAKHLHVSANMTFMHKI